jgi:hypothetical protein
VRPFTFARLARVLATMSVAAMAIAGTALVASPAQAQTAQHCLVVMPDPGFERCFVTFEEARQFAADAGAIGPSKDAPGAWQNNARPAAGPSAGVANHLTLLSIEYDLPFWNPLGATRWVYGTNGPCTTPVSNTDYQLPDWSVYGFDQRISSFQTFGNCWTKHYDLVNFGGLVVGYQGSQALINAALNNDTSSEQWS